jgi:uncharacterized membrane protein
MRDREAIDAELRLVAALRRAAREPGRAAAVDCRRGRAAGRTQHAGFAVIVASMLAWLAIGLSSIAAACGVAASAVHFGGTLHYGDVGGWLAGIGSIWAAVVAVGIAIHTNNRQDRKEDEERAKSQVRALRRAKRVALENDPRHFASRVIKIPDADPFEPSQSYGVRLRNYGSTPIYEIKWALPLVVLSSIHETVEPKATWAESAVLAENEDLTVIDADPFALPGDGATSEIRVTFSRGREPIGHNRPFRPVTTYHRVSYVDEEGYRFGWVYRRINETVPITAENSVRGH